MKNKFYDKLKIEVTKNNPSGSSTKIEMVKDRGIADKGFKGILQKLKILIGHIKLKNKEIPGWQLWENAELGLERGV